MLVGPGLVNQARAGRCTARGAVEVVLAVVPAAHEGEPFDLTGVLVGRELDPGANRFQDHPDAGGERLRARVFQLNLNERERERESSRTTAAPRRSRDGRSARLRWP